MDFDFMKDFNSRTTMGAYNALCEIPWTNDADYIALARRADELSNGGDITRYHVETAAKELGGT